MGGIVLLVAAAFLLFRLRRKRHIKEERRATLPPIYPVNQGGDMSEQLAGNTVSARVPLTCRVTTDIFQMPPHLVVVQDQKPSMMNQLTQAPSQSLN